MNTIELALYNPMVTIFTIILNIKCFALYCRIYLLVSHGSQSTANASLNIINWLFFVAET
jgi:hypothetical protein